MRRLTVAPDLPPTGHASLRSGRARPARAADAVTEWSLLADQLGRGAANWHTLAIMHQAMHDALNAALPIYQRWAPPDADEPDPAGALPQAAMAAAAAAVLSELHPDQAPLPPRDCCEPRSAALAGGSPVQAGVWLGDAIGAAAVRRRAHDGYSDVLPLPHRDGAGTLAAHAAGVSGQQHHEHAPVPAHFAGPGRDGAAARARQPRLRPRRGDHAPARRGRER